MIKLIVSDLDGTILQHGMVEVPGELIDVINQLGEQGIHFIAASGRPYSNLKMLFRGVTTPMSFIGENGAVYMINNELHVPCYHKMEDVHELIREIRKDPDCEMFYSCADTIYIEAEPDEVNSSIDDRDGYSITWVSDLLEVEHLPLKLAIYNMDGLARTAPKYKELFLSKMNVITSGDFWLDFMPYGVNKGVALQHITETMNIRPEECMAFGDQWNDVEMLSFVGTSYAMENGAPGVADYATYTTNSVLTELKKLLHQ